VDPAPALQTSASAVRRCGKLWLAAWIESTRPLASLVPGTLAASPAIAGTGIVMPHAIAAGLAMTALAMFGFVVNDIADYRKDQAARIQRPIAQGALSRESAAWLAVALLLLACIFGVAAGWGLITLAITAAALLLYSPLSHRYPPGKGVYVAGLCCLPLYYGALAAEKTFPWYCYAVLGCFVLGRELVMDADEVRGDSRAGMRTIAAMLGVRRTAAIGVILMILASAALLTIARGVVATAAAAAMLASMSCIIAWPGLALGRRIGLSRISMVFGAIAVACGG
jgi:4-hydroxybenzoate polyprenyltransferase